MEKEKLQIEKMQQSGRKYLLQGLVICQCCKSVYYGMSNAKEEEVTIVVLENVLVNVTANQYARIY